MKNSFIIIFLLAAIAIGSVTKSNGQSFLQPKLGIKAGLNLSNLYLQGVSEENSLLKVHFGVTAKMMISPSFAIQPELLYSPKGAQLTWNRDNVNGTAKITLSNLDLPVLAVVKVAKYVRVYAGPYFSYLVAVNPVNKTARETYDFEAEISRKNFKPFDFGLVGGAELGMAFFSIGLRYNYGMLDVGRDRQFFGQTYNFPEARTRLIQFYIGINAL